MRPPPSNLRPHLAPLRVAAPALATAAALAALALPIALTRPAAVAAEPPATTVTARPPLEAVPAASTAPMTRAQRARVRQCDAAAKSKRLDGHERQQFIQACLHPHPKPKPNVTTTPALKRD
ncbi:MAG: PsiF family protein [Steroidobacteraceae bacterium]